MLKNLITTSIALALLAASCVVKAENKPAIPELIRIIVPFGAGASTDIIARATASQLAEKLKTNVIVENKPGASSMIGVDTVLKGKKDGSILLLTTPSTVTAAATMKHVSFDLDKDLVPIANLGEGPMIVATSMRSGIKTPADLVNAAKSKPGELTYGTSGIGTLAHMIFEMISQAADIRMTHVPYKGSTYSVLDLSSGIIDVSVGANSSFAAQTKAGRVVPIAVTSSEPSPAFPKLPTMASAAPGFNVSIWAIVFAPAGIDPEMAALLNKELNEISTSKQVQEVMQADGATPKPLSLDRLHESVRKSYEQWKKLATDKNIVIE